MGLLGRVADEGEFAFVVHEAVDKVLAHVKDNPCGDDERDLGLLVAEIVGEDGEDMVDQLERKEIGQRMHNVWGEKNNAILVARPEKCQWTGKCGC